MLSTPVIAEHLNVAELRRCLRDVVALSTLPALWDEATPGQIATNLTDALASVLRADVLYVRLEQDAEGSPHEVGRLTDARSHASVGREIGEALAPWLADRASGEPVLVPHLWGSGSLRIMVVPLGTTGELGFMAVGAQRADFPTDTERLLLRVATNQAALAVRSAHRFAERQRAEQELRDYVDNATVILHWVGPDGTILWANQAELDLLGYTQDEYIGRNIAEFHADPEVIDDILSRLAANQTLRDVEARLRCKDGSIRWVLIDSSVRWEHDSFLHTRCFTRDITARKQAEDRYQTLFEHAADAVLVVDAAGRCLDANPAALDLLGYRREVLLQHRLSDLLDRVAHVTIASGASMIAADTWRGDVELRRADGSIVPVEVQTAAVDLPDGRILLFVMRDISARRAVERMQQEFLALVTHE
jgi:PAS domain S-box-containing protein